MLANSADMGLQFCPVGKGLKTGVSLMASERCWQFFSYCATFEQVQASFLTALLFIVQM